jgi:ActR/RegA family two-component response regulator
MGGYTIRNVTRLRPAIEAVEQAAYDVAVIDARLEFSTLPEIVAALRQVQPNLPVVITSPYEDDSKLLPQVGAQGFVAKPYIARILAPVLEDAIARGYSPYTVETQPNLAQTLENEESQQIIEPMLEASRQIAPLVEPPTTADDSTISEVIQQALQPEVSQKIYATMESHPLPDDETEVLQEPQPIQNNDQEEANSEPTPAEAALNATLGATSLDALLDEIRHYAHGHLGEPHPVPNPTTTLIAAIEPPPDHTPIYPPPYHEDTRWNIIPPPPRLPDQEWLDQADSPTVIPSVPAESPEPALPEEELVPVTLEEITQQMVSAIVDDLVEEEIQREADSLRLEQHVLAHYALQLTNFAIENSAMGVVITRGDERLAQAGSLDPAAWDQVIGLIYENWNTPGDSRTRVLYRNLGFGNLLLYSIQTVDDLTLTMTFDAETPLRVIRRQAARLTESLQNIPEPRPEDILAQPTPPPSPPSLPEMTAAEWEESSRVGVGVADVVPLRESPLTEEAREGIDTDLREGSREVAPQVPDQQPQEAVPALPKPTRQAGTYTSYGCVWLVENPRDAINPAAAEMILGWVQDICRERDWDLEDAHIEPEWIYLAVHVPTTTLPSDVVTDLMHGTAERALALDPSGSHQSPWGEGYLIRTPANSLTTQDIDRFIQFYRSTRLN